MKKRLLALVLIVCLKPGTFACGWDWDTIKMEKEQFPTVHELIVGKFLRHSTAFYYWRVKDRTEKIKQFPDSLALYDDLAWANDKIGEHEEAIRIMQEKEALHPGLYETYANMGTSYIHNAQYEKGLEYIKKAIEINPEAHFGREIYQQYVVEYVLSCQDSTGSFSLPLSTGKAPDFYSFLKERHLKDAIGNGSSKEKEMLLAIKGVTGMMKFGDFSSPVLLECLGDLLYASTSGHDRGAGHLASRAYLKAAWAMPKNKPEAKQAYEEKAKASIERQFSGEFHHLNGSELAEAKRSNHAYHSHTNTFPSLEIMLANEINAANTWYASIEEDEKTWIKQKVNVDSAFAAKYYNEPDAEVPNYSPYVKPKPDVSIDDIKTQLQRSESMIEIYKGIELSEEDKILIDSLYKSETQENSGSNTNEDESNASSDPKSQKSEDTESKSNMMWLFVGIGLIVVITIVVIARRMRK